MVKYENSIGFYDPRSLKTHLENEGYTVWIDYEQVGVKNTLFEDIVDGIRNSDVVIACVSNEYAESDSCMKEFRFSSNLKKPIILCVFGSHMADHEWRRTELGIISCLNCKEINFQLENPDAYNDLVKELKTKKVEPAIKINSGKEIDRLKFNGPIDDIISDDQDIGVNDFATNAAYTELFELIQRKFLRQISNASDFTSKPFPRLFVIDLVSQTKENLNIITDIRENAGSQTKSKKTTKKPDERMVKTCLKALCEYEYGWVRYIAKIFT